MKRIAIVLMAMAWTGVAMAQSARIDRLAQTLELTEGQKTALDQKLGDEATDLWKVAAALQGTLTSSQKEMLLERGKVARAYAQGVRDGSRPAARSAQGRGQSGVRGAAAGVKAPQRVAARGRSAAPGRSARRPDQARGPFMDKVLTDLTDDQLEALTDLRKRNRSEMARLQREWKAGDLDRDGYREQVRSTRAALRNEADAVLTAEQKAKLNRLNDRRRPRQSGTRRFEAGGPDSMASALNLTEAQRETVQIHAALAAVRPGPRMATSTRPQRRRTGR